MFLREVFFSQLYHRKVEDAKGRRIGLLRDVVVSLDCAYPTVVGLSVGEGGYIPIGSVMGGLAGETFCVMSDVRKRAVSDEYEAAKLLLDKQVLDCSGKRVHRVNDIVFVSYGREDAEERCCFAGVDVGIGGICRRIGSSWLADMMKRRLVGWHHIAISDEGEVPFCLRLTAQRMGEMTAEDIAAVCRQFDRVHRRAFLNQLPYKAVCRALMRMSFDERRCVLSSLGEDEVVLLLRSMPRAWRDEVCEGLPSFYRYRCNAKSGGAS